MSTDAIVKDGKKMYKSTICESHKIGFLKLPEMSVLDEKD